MTDMAGHRLWVVNLVIAGDDEIYAEDTLTLGPHQR